MGTIHVDHRIDETKAEIAEAIVNMCAHAERQPHVLGVTGPSKWDEAHTKLDALLDNWEQAQG